MFSTARVESSDARGAQPISRAATVSCMMPRGAVEEAGLLPSIFSTVSSSAHVANRRVVTARWVRMGTAPGTIRIDSCAAARHSDHHRSPVQSAVYHCAFACVLGAEVAATAFVAHTTDASIVSTPTLSAADGRRR